MYEGDRVGL